MTDVVWVEIDVTVVAKEKDRFLVSDGENEAWVLFSEIHEDSEIDADSEEDDEGMLRISPEFLDEIGFEPNFE